MQDKQQGELTFQVVNFAHTFSLNGHHDETKWSFLNFLASCTNYKEFRIIILHFLS